MLNLSLNELKLIAKSRAIKGYSSMSEDKLLSALNSSESLKKKLDDTESTRNDKTLKTTMYDPAEINKAIREIRKENRNKDKILRDLDFTLDPEKDYYEPRKTASAFNNKYIQYESIGDKDKNLSIKEYIDIIRPYLSDITNNHKTQGEWKIHLKMVINFVSSKDSDETCNMHTESDNIEVMTGSETDESIKELFESLL